MPSLNHSSGSSTQLALPTASLPPTKTRPASPSGLRNGEIVRKILHMLPGLLPFVLPFLEHPDPMDANALRFITIITVVLTAVFIACFRIVRRPGEDNLVSTVVSYPATILATLLLFPAQPEFACVVVVVLGIGDGAAYIFGRTLGAAHLPWNPQKTWAGTIGFVVCAAPLAALAYAMEATPSVSPMVAVACGVMAALAGAFAESLPMKVTDNLRVGVAASLAVVATHFLLVG